MNHHSIFRLLLFIASLVFLSCQAETPENNFGIAVLNSNMLVGFASDGMWRELESPSAKMGKTKDEILTMQRIEVIDTKIKFIEEGFEKIKGLKQTEDTKEIIEASRALHQYVLPVYKGEYTQLAKAFDSGASKDELERQGKAIQSKYFSTFEALHKRLMNSGKSYATKHHINVQWDIQTAPM